jgi:hypothetical protein
MNGTPIRPGWALLAILLLWGLAGALDQPLSDEESAQALSIRHAASVAMPVRLRCQVDPDEPRDPWPPSRRGEPRSSLVSLHEAKGDGCQQPVWPTRSLRCVVIDE